VVNLACQKPEELGYAQQLGTTQLLAKQDPGRSPGPTAQNSSAIWNTEIRSLRPE